MWVFSNFFLLLDGTALKVFVVVRRVSVFQKKDVRILWLKNGRLKRRRLIIFTCLAVSIWLDFVLATFQIRSVVSFVQTARTLPVSREIWSSIKIIYKSKMLCSSENPDHRKNLSKFYELKNRLFSYLNSIYGVCLNPCEKNNQQNVTFKDP